MAIDLITTDELIDGWPGAADLSSTEQASLVSAASRRFELLCDRIFGTGTYVEISRPGRSRVIRTHQKPITDIARVATDFGTVLIIQNTNRSVSRATAKFTGTAPNFTGLSLTSFIGTAATTTNLTFATYPLLSDLAAAINGISGWTASTSVNGYGDFSGWQSTWLAGDVGTMQAGILGLEIKAYTRDLAYACDPDMASKGTIELFEGRPDGFRYPDRRYGTTGMGYTGISGIVGGLDPRVGAVWVQYTAGAATADVDPSIKEAVKALAKWLYVSNKFVGMQSESDGKYTYSRANLTTGVPKEVDIAVNRYGRQEII